MTEAQARTTANVIMAGAAVGAAVVVLRSPSRRRQAWQFARMFATGPLAVFLATTVRNAWEESGRRRGVSVR
jgi:hypothetical protein